MSKIIKRFNWPIKLEDFHSLEVLIILKEENVLKTHTKPLGLQLFINVLNRSCTQSYT